MEALIYILVGIFFILLIAGIVSLFVAFANMIEDFIFHDDLDD